MTLQTRVSTGVVLCFIAIICSVAWAQATTSVQGTIVDPTGALVPDAALTLEDIRTAAVRRAMTDGEGRYEIPQLAPGTYRLRAEKAGFRAVVMEGLQLLVNTPARVDLQFVELGSLPPTYLTVTPPAINRVDATIGNTILNSQIGALPMERRDVGAILSLQPGVVHTGIVDRNRPDTRAGAVAGARSDQNNFTLDGVDVNDQQTGEAFKSVLPLTPDSVQELRVLTANPTASQGRSSGGQIALVTRRGENETHGAAYEYHRNTVTTANTFFNNSTVDPLTGKTLERPKLIRNIFGAALGGPVKENHLFFFFNFEGVITRKEEPQLRIVPSTMLRQGILQYVDASGAVQSVTPQELQMMDPLGVGPNPAVLDLLRQYPAGNDPSQGDGLNFVGLRFNAPLEEDSFSYLGRIDYTGSDGKHNIFVRGALADFEEDEQPQQFPGQPASRILLNDSKGVAVGYTWVVSPTLVNDFRWGFTRQSLDYTDGNTSPGLQLRELDSIDNFDARNNSRNLPVHSLSDDLSLVKGPHHWQFGVTFRNIHNKRATEQRTYPFYRSNNGWMQNLGRDVLPQGIDESFETPYIQAQMALLGTISEVDVTYFANRNGSLFPTPHIPRREFISNEFEWYVQDQWKVLPRLTVTAGLRYSYYAPPYEKNGYQVRANVDVDEWFANRQYLGDVGVPSNANPLLSFVLAGKANNAPSFFDPDRNNFAPRLAVAWSPSYASGPLHTLFGDPGKSSIRFGVSVSYDRTGGMFPVTADLSGAIGLATFVTTPVGAFNYDTAPRFSGLENLGSIPLPPAPTVGFPATPDSSSSTGFMVNTKLQTPYYTTFNFSISRELSRDFTLETAYVGRIGKRLLVQSDFAAPLVNFKDAQSGQTWVEAAGIVADLIDENVPVSGVPSIPFIENVFAPLAGGGLSASQAFYETALFVAPSWTDLLHYLDISPTGSTIHGPYTFFQQQFDWLPTWTNLGQSSYHSLQVILRKRFSGGLQADFNYTLAKALDNGSVVESEGQGAGQVPNAFNPRQSISYSDFDIRHQINSNFVFDLPFGRGRPFGANMRPVLEQTLGGWRLSSILRWRSGFPFPSGSGNGFAFPTNYFVNGPPTLKAGSEPPEVRVTKNGQPNVFADSAKAYDSFEHTRSGFSGNRNALHGPGFFSLDVSIQKTFSIAGRSEIQFRWEAFNAFNNVNFDGRVYPTGNQGIDFDLDSRSTFGQFRTLAGSPRVMQFALRYQF